MTRERHEVSPPLSQRPFMPELEAAPRGRTFINTRVTSTREAAMVRLLSLILLAVASLSACSTVGGGIERAGNWIANTAEDWKHK
jgi:predicted small secreted protein